MLAVDALLAPGPAEFDEARRLVAERIAAAGRRAATLGEPPLADADGAGPPHPRRPARARSAAAAARRPGGRGDHRQRPAARVRDRGRAQAPHRCASSRTTSSCCALVRRAIGPLRTAARRDEPDGRRAARRRLAPERRDPAAHVGRRRTSRSASSCCARARSTTWSRLGTLTPEAAAFLEAAVRAGLNMLISGGTGSGKTTCLNALGACDRRGSTSAS